MLNGKHSVRNCKLKCNSMLNRMRDEKMSMDYELFSILCQSKSSRSLPRMAKDDSEVAAAGSEAEEDMKVIVDNDRARFQK